MRNLSKKEVKLIGSAPNLEALKQMIISKLYWNVQSITLSERYTLSKKEAYDICNTKGLIAYCIIVIEKDRAKLYDILG